MSLMLGPVLAGMTISFALFTGAAGASSLLHEDEEDTLARLLTTPTARAAVLGGKFLAILLTLAVQVVVLLLAGRLFFDINWGQPAATALLTLGLVVAASGFGLFLISFVLAMFAVVFLQGLLLVALGQLALGVDYAREPLGTLLMLVALALWVTSLGLFIGTLARGEEQVIMFSLVAMFLLAALGGAWFPLEIAGQAFSAIGHLTPTAWAMDGFQDIVVRGQGLGSVLLPAGILLGFAAAFAALALWRFRFE